MKQNLSWKANSSSASQKIPRLLWSQSFYCRAPKRAQTYQCPEPDESSPHIPNVFKIHFNITLPLSTRSSQWSLPFTFPLMYVFISSPTVLHVLPISPTVLWSPDKYLTRTINHAFFSSLLLHPPPYANAFLSTLFSNTLSLCSSVNARHSSTPKQNVRQNYSYVHFNLQVFS